MPCTIAVYIVGIYLILYCVAFPHHYRMDTKDSCEKVIGALNGALLHGGKEPLMIKFADSSNKKKLSQSKTLFVSNVPISG